MILYFYYINQATVYILKVDEWCLWKIHRLPEAKMRRRIVRREVARRAAIARRIRPLPGEIVQEKAIIPVLKLSRKVASNSHVEASEYPFMFWSDIFILSLFLIVIRSTLIDCFVMTNVINNLVLSSCRTFLLLCINNYTIILSLLRF